MSLPPLIVGTRHCRVLTVSNINSDATGVDIICILQTGGTPIPQKLGKISRLVQPYTLQISRYRLVADGRDAQPTRVMENLMSDSGDYFL